MPESRPNSDIDLVFDLDGVIAYNNNGNYADAQPIPLAIENINKLYDQGYHITICTARYGKRARGREYQTGYIETSDWLKKHKVKYHELLMGKAAGDIYVDDKAARVRGENPDEWENALKQIAEIHHKNKYGMNL